jgi:hypothetical protein
VLAKVCNRLICVCDVLYFKLHGIDAIKKLPSLELYIEIIIGTCVSE